MMNEPLRVHNPYTEWVEVDIFVGGIEDTNLVYRGWLGPEVTLAMGDIKPEDGFVRMTVRAPKTGNKLLNTMRGVL